MKTKKIEWIYSAQVQNTLSSTRKSQNKEHFDCLHTYLISVTTYTVSHLRYSSYSTTKFQSVFSKIIFLQILNSIKNLQISLPKKSLKLKRIFSF